MTKRNRIILSAAVAATFASAAFSPAAVWDNDTTDGLWATPNNWNPNGLPAAGDNILIDNTAGGTSLTVGANRTINGTFDFTRGTAFALSDASARQLLGSGAMNISGAGTLTLTNVSIGNTDNSSTRALNVTGSLTMNNAANAIAVGSITGSGTIAAGAGGRVQVYSPGSFTWQGSLGGTGYFEQLQRNQTTTLSGAAGSIQMSATTGTIYGTLVLDNTTTNNDDRWWGSAVNTANGTSSLKDGWARFKLIGNTTVDTTERVNVVRSDRANAFLEVDTQPGRTTTLSLASFDAVAAAGGFMTHEGDDLGNTARIVYRTPGLTNNVLHGSARVGNEFATHVATFGVQALPTAGRPGQISGAASTANVLANSAQTTLGAATTIYTLKIDGSHAVNLGGNDLTLSSGGLIQAGGANTISNGVLSSGAASFLYITNTHDLDISADIVTSKGNANARGISKNGAGTLTLSGTLTNSTTPGAVMDINWFEGNLVYSSPSNAQIRGEAKGPYSLTKNGNATLTINQDIFANLTPQEFTGGVNLNGGILRAISRDNGARTLGSGPVNIANTATLYFGSGINNGTPANSTIVNDVSGGGLIQVRGREATPLIQTLRSQGGDWNPSGDRILTVDGNLAFQANPTNATDFGDLVIDIIGSGATAGTDYDKLDILGTLAGLNATAANATVDLVVNVAAGLNLSGDTFTILDSTSNLTGLNFRSITWNGTAPGQVAYNSDGTVVLSQLTSVPIPEPTALGLVGLGLSTFIRPRRRRQA